MTDIIVFTDGACSANGKKNARAGIGIYFPNSELDNISEEFTQSPMTNQRAELCAIYRALHSITDKLEFNKIMVVTDSLYSIKSLTEWIKQWEKNDWKTANKKPVQNLDLIKPIYSILKKYGSRIKFNHVRSHTGKKDFNSIGNAFADDLATKAIKQSL